MRITNTYILLVLIIFFVITNIAVNATERIEKLSGKWGNKNNEIGVIFPSKLLLPTAPRMCIGGFTIDTSSTIWVTDSVNHAIKKFRNGKVSSFKISSKFLGELCIKDKMLFVVTIEPNQVLIFDKNTNEQIKKISIPFKNPGRILAFSDSFFCIEEMGKGIWIFKEGKTYKHPSSPLEAIGYKSTVYGTEFQFEPDSRNIISTKIGERVEEPDLFYAFNTFPKDRIVYSKLFGVIDKKPILATVEARDTSSYQLYKLNGIKATCLRAKLPILDGPFLDYTWKFINNKFYGFSGTYQTGWKIEEFNVVFK